MIALAAANRRNADADELARLADSLTTTVVAVDATAPVPTITFPATDTQTRLAIKSLLERLAARDPKDPAAPALIAELASAKNDSALAKIVARAADLVHEHMANSCSANACRPRRSSPRSPSAWTKWPVICPIRITPTAVILRTRNPITINVMSQMRELTDEVASATELGVLQSLVNVRLERVAQHVSNFRAREEFRLLEVNGRAERMRMRIAELERETSDLHSRLDSEKQGARIDPLTGIANRKVFEERFAHEIAQKPRAPLAGGHAAVGSGQLQSRQ